MYFPTYKGTATWHAQLCSMQNYAPSHQVCWEKALDLNRKQTKIDCCWKCGRHSININYLAFHSFFFSFSLWLLISLNGICDPLISAAGKQKCCNASILWWLPNFGNKLLCLYLKAWKDVHRTQPWTSIFFYGFLLLIVMIWQKKILSVFLDFLCILTGAHFCSYKRALVSQKLDKINSPGIGKIKFDGTAFFSSTF